MNSSTIRRKIAVAPMMAWTDRHCRYFLRQLGPSAVLYTEMITAQALKHGDRERMLEFHPAEHPVVAQLGGSDPALMRDAAVAARDAGYDAVNINVGCPSDRVQSGQFGACLMANPVLVAECFSAMQAAVDVPVTVKTRIGIDDLDSFEFLDRFVTTLEQAGCRTVIVHARIAILEGLSPKENRSVPPLRYERVYELKDAHPELEIVLNGGIETIPQIDGALERVDGVMIGRQAYHNPWFLADVERHFRPDWRAPSRREVVEAMVPYAEAELVRGEKLKRITRHMLGLFAGEPGARAWRRHLSENAHLDGAGPEVLLEALDAMPEAA